MTAVCISANLAGQLPPCWNTFPRSHKSSSESDSKHYSLILARISLSLKRWYSCAKGVPMSINDALYYYTGIPENWRQQVVRLAARPSHRPASNERAYKTTFPSSSPSYQRISHRKRISKTSSDTYIISNFDSVTTPPWKENSVSWLYGNRLNDAVL